METLPLYWSLIAEVAIALIGILTAVIFIILRDKKKLFDYSIYLKSAISKLKKKISELQEEALSERVLELVASTRDHVRDLYQKKFGAEIDAEGEDTKPSVDRFVLSVGFQLLTAELSALENSQEADATWEKIRSEITPLIENYLPEFSEDESLSDQLQNALTRIDNLEKFKQLYLELQTKVSESVKEGEGFNQLLKEALAGGEGAEALLKLIEKHNNHYINMGKLVGMDKKQHHAGVSISEAFDQEYMSERQEEVKRLKNKIASQFEEIWALQNKLSQKDKTSETKTTSAEELEKSIAAFTRQMKDAEMCIETMDLEIQALTNENNDLKQKLEEGGGQAEATIMPEEFQKEMKAKEALIERFAKESKELLSCINGLEETGQEQTEEIKALSGKLAIKEKQLALREQEFKALKQKFAKLQADYNLMENEYINVVNK